MISIVLPAYNEEGAVGNTVRAALALAGAHGIDHCEVVVVDDGSTDGTTSVATTAGARVVRHPHNLGYGRALKAGIEAAMHDTIVILDADGTYPVADVPALLDVYTQGFDMVVGTRTGEGFREAWLKRTLRAVLTLLVEFTVGRRVPDVNSGLRVFSRTTILPYFQHLCDTFSFTTSLTLAYMMTGRFVAYRQIPYLERVGRTKVHLLRDTLRTLQYIVQAILYYNPIKLFLLLAAVAFAWTLLAAGVLLARVHVTSAAIVVAVGFLFSLLLFGLGLVADLLRQIMQK